MGADSQVRNPSSDTNVVFEPRLQKTLKKLFQDVQDSEDDQSERYQPHIQGIRFPKWLTRPSCNRLVEAREFGSETKTPRGGVLLVPKKRDGVFMCTNKIYRSV